MKYLSPALIFLLFAWLSLWWYYSCTWCLGEADPAPEAPVQIDPNAEALAKKVYEDSIAKLKLAQGLHANNESGEMVFRLPGNVQIKKSTADVMIPSQLSNFGGIVSNYIAAHQDQEILISGYETSTEQQSTDSLGLKRALYIKDLLLKAGVNEDRILTSAIQKEYAYDQDDIYNGGIELTFKTLTEDRLSEIEAGIANKTLYSLFGSKDFQPDATLANYTKELKHYLEKYPSKKVYVEGHTDNIGKTSSNLTFGLKRANNVKNYFISQGIPSSIIKVSSKGESEPAYPNDTKENRAKNRRIEITVN